MAQFPSTTSASGIWGLNPIVAAILGQNWPYSAYVTEVFTATGTWTCPAGVAAVEYLVVAGGGAGGGQDGADKMVGGGGGAGGFRVGTGLAVTAGTSYTITVGSGGAGANGRGSSGTDTSLLVVAEGVQSLAY